MRLAYSHININPFREATKTKLQFYKDIGLRVLGFKCDNDPSDDDVKRLKDLFGELDLEVGQIIPFQQSCLLHPDKKTLLEHRKKIARTMEVCRKLGAANVQCSIGSLNPDDIWGIHPENHTQKALDMLVENAREVAKITEDNQVMLAPETTLWTVVNSIGRMKEYVDRVDSPLMKITFDIVNYMTYDRIFESGKYARCALATLGDRIGAIHVKDVIVTNDQGYKGHIHETEMGTGVLDHETLIRVSTQLEPWKAFILEHIRDEQKIKPAYDHIQKIASKIGHSWSSHHCTREKCG
ncbi:sugar phosphate isomerase/epimerase family protein [Candidatus Latescibacterota bacterium]